VRQQGALSNRSDDAMRLGEVIVAEQSLALATVAASDHLRGVDVDAPHFGHGSVVLGELGARGVLRADKSEGGLPSVRSSDAHAPSGRRVATRERRLGELEGMGVGIVKVERAAALTKELVAALGRAASHLGSSWPSARSPVASRSPPAK
jgi:hypothetical protein